MYQGYVFSRCAETWGEPSREKNRPRNPSRFCTEGRRSTVSGGAGVLMNLSGTSVSGCWRISSLRNRSHFVQEQTFERAQHNLAARLGYHTVPLPLAQHAAGGKLRDVGGVRQVFISDADFHSRRGSDANRTGEVDQSPRQSLFCRVTSLGNVDAKIAGERFGNDGKGIFPDRGMTQRELANRRCGPTPVPSFP